MEQNIQKAGNFLPRVEEPNDFSEVNRNVVSLTAPSSVAAEQYRTLYYRLERMRELKPMKVVAITSAVAGEGKTVTAVNLALASARANPDRRILLIDADLRRSQVAEMLGIRGKPGLCELLTGDAELREVVRRFKSTRLAVIPGGGVAEDSTQLLASSRMKELVKWLREGFDEIYIDLPPTLPFADAEILSSQMDGVVLVVRAGMTSSSHVHEALEHLTGASVVGCVLNGADLHATPYLKEYLK